MAMTSINHVTKLGSLIGFPFRFQTKIIFPTCQKVPSPRLPSSPSTSSIISTEQTHPDFQPRTAFPITIKVQVVKKMADPSLDPSLTRPTATQLLAATH